MWIHFLHHYYWNLHFLSPGVSHCFPQWFTLQEEKQKGIKMSQRGWICYQQVSTLRDCINVALSALSSPGSVQRPTRTCWRTSCHALLTGLCAHIVKAAIPAAVSPTNRPYWNIFNQLNKLTFPLSNDLLRFSCTSIHSDKTKTELDLLFYKKLIRSDLTGVWKSFCFPKQIFKILQLHH